MGTGLLEGSGASLFPHNKDRGRDACHVDIKPSELASAVVLTFPRDEDVCYLAVVFARG